MEVKMLMSKSMAAEGKLDGAIAKIHEVLKLDPEFRECKQVLKDLRKMEDMKRRADQLLRTRRFTESIELCSDTLAVSPWATGFNATVFVTRASCWVELRSLDKAISDCSSSLDLNPRLVKALLCRARCYVQRSEFEEAMEDFERAVQIDPNQKFLLQHEMGEARRKASAPADYYKVLGLTPSATDKEIRTAYKKLALQFHPDKQSGGGEAAGRAERQFKLLSEAYAVLYDEQKRKEYDRSRNQNTFENKDSSQSWNNSFHFKRQSKQWDQRSRSYNSWQHR
eukprot:751748-Hanusia_phi.AAC.2